MQTGVGPTIIFLRGENADRSGSDHNILEGIRCEQKWV